MTDVKQTGAEIFAQVLEALDVPLAEWPVADPLLAALDGCVLLTASEADRMYDALIETPGKRSENWVAMRALLISPEEPPPDEVCDHGLPFSVPCPKCATDEDAVNDAGCPTC